MSTYDHPPSPLPSAEPPQSARVQLQHRMISRPTNRDDPLSVSSVSSSVNTVLSPAEAAGRVEETSSVNGVSSCSIGTASATERLQHPNQKQHQQLPPLSSLFGPAPSERQGAPLNLLPSPLPPTYAQQQRQPSSYQPQQSPSQAYEQRPLSELRNSGNWPERRQQAAPVTTGHWSLTAQKKPDLSSYAPLPSSMTPNDFADAVLGRRRGSSSSSTINERPPLTPPLPASTTATEATADGSGSGKYPDGLGPKIWTGTQFLPRFVRTAEVPGEGMCYFYDDGSYCKTVIDGEAVNAHWGVTKAGKPRKRLAIACVLCREKKVKCDPDFPRCVQCQKFGRPCQFKNAPRGHNAVSPGATTPAWPDEDAPSVRAGQPQPQPQQHHDYNHDQNDQTNKRMRTGYDHYKETGGNGGGSASSRSSPTAMSIATVDSARPGSARSMPPLPPLTWAGQPQRSPQSSYTHATAAAAAAADVPYPPTSNPSSSASAAAPYRQQFPLSPIPAQPTTMDQQPRNLPSDLPRFHLPPPRSPPRSQPTTDRPRLQDEVLRRPW